MMAADSVGVEQVETDDEAAVDPEAVKLLIEQNNRLADRVDELEARLDKQADITDRKLDATEARVGMAQLASAITDREIDASNDMVESSKLILEEFKTLRATVRELEQFKDEYGVGEARDKDEAWAQILTAARNKQDNPNHVIQGTKEITLFVETLETVTGYSDRHCSNLIDEYASEKRGCRKVEYEPASAANNNNATRKQLVVDLAVWGETA